jgi:NAD(P)-dependent dehydrogenase (short-subunit alcohol dehydrogenase family)
MRKIAVITGAGAGVGRATADRVESELGDIDVWVNVAMATVFAPVAKLTPEEIERGTRVTYLGQVHGMMSALKRMRPDAKPLLKSRHRATYSGRRER